MIIYVRHIFLITFGSLKDIALYTLSEINIKLTAYQKELPQCDFAMTFFNKNIIYYI